MKPPVEFTLECFAKAEHWCYLAYSEWQKANDDLRILEESGKDLLEIIKSELDTGVDKISEAKLERMARASEKWSTYRNGLYEAIRISGESRAKWLSAERYWSTVQSGLAYRRDEMRRL